MRKRTLPIVFALVLLLEGCTDSKAAMRAVEANGLTDVSATGYRWTGCGDNDSVHTGFKAKNAQGKEVTGVVCGGWGWFGKKSTVRFD